MPWGHDGYEVEVSAVEAVVADIPKNARTVTPVKASKILNCGLSTIYNMMANNELLTMRVGVGGTRGHQRIVVKVDRVFDPNREHHNSLEEAKLKRSNVGI